MRNFIFGFIVGVIVSAVGFTGIARLMDRGVNKIKQVSTEMAR